MSRRAPRPRTVSRTAALLAALAFAAGTTFFAPAANATPVTLTVSIASTPSIDASTHLMTPSFAVSGADDNTEVTVVLSTDKGKIRVQPSGLDPTSAAGLTLSSGYHWTGDNVIRFSGTLGDVNAALQWVWLDGNSQGDAPINGAKLTLYVEPTSGGQSVVYSPDSGHFYEYVSSPGISWLNAKAAAEGKSFGAQQGYLAQIPSAAINAFITSKIPGASNVWIGARASMFNENSQPDGLANNGVDATILRNWQWVGGPLDGQSFTTCTTQTGNGSCQTQETPMCSADAYSHWDPAEPNNYVNTMERYAVTNWGGQDGRWNDLPNSTGGISGYVVEYGGGSTGSCDTTATFTGVSLSAQTLTVTSGSAVSAPGAPRNLTTTPADQALTVTFDAPASDGGSAIIGYTYRINGGSWQQVPATGSGPYTLPLSGLTNDTEYTVEVSALNAVGFGPAASQTGTPTDAPPVTTSSQPPAPTSSSTPTSSSASSTMTSTPATSTAPSTSPSSTKLSTDVTAIPTNNRVDPVTFTSSVAPPAPPALPAVSEVSDTSTSALELSEGEVPRSGAFTATATGFQPGSVVDFYLWSTPVYLGSAIADIHGVAVLPVELAPEYIGEHHVQSIGTGLLGEPRNLAQPITVVDQLASTGVRVAQLGTMGLLLLIMGAAGVHVVRRSPRALFYPGNHL